MRKSILSIAIIVALGASLTSCRDTPKEEAAEASIERAAEDTGAAIEEAADDAADATEGALEETGREIDEAVRETKEAGQAVEDAFDDDDN